MQRPLNIPCQQATRCSELGAKAWKQNANQGLRASRGRQPQGRWRGWLVGLGLCLLGFVTGCVELSSDELPVVVVPPSPPASGPCDLPPDDEIDLDLPVWDLAVSDADWDKLHEDVYADVDVPAALCVAGTSYAIELELQGASTRKLAKKSFDLKWKRQAPLRTWPYDTEPPPTVAIRKLFLKAMGKDQSLIREALSFDLYRKLGYDTPNTGFTNLRINGKYWGLYAVIQPVNKTYLAEHGLPTGGRLYKGVRKHGSRADFAPGRDLTRAFETELYSQAAVLRPEDDPDADDDASDDDEYEARDEEETERDEAPQAEVSDAEASDDSELTELPPEYLPLEDFVTRLQTTPLDQDAFTTEIDPVFSLDAYIDRMIWVSFTRNGDAVAQNFYLYLTRDERGEHWRQIPWDSDIALGADYRDVEGYIGPEAGPLIDGGNYFSRRLIKVPELRARYIERYSAVLGDELLEMEGFERLAHYQQRLAHDLREDQLRWKRETDPQTAFERIGDFLAARAPTVLQALSELELR